MVRPEELGQRVLLVQVDQLVLELQEQLALVVHPGHLELVLPEPQVLQGRAVRLVLLVPEQLGQVGHQDRHQLVNSSLLLLEVGRQQPVGVAVLLRENTAMMAIRSVFMH